MNRPTDSRIVERACSGSTPIACRTYEIIVGRDHPLTGEPMYGTMSYRKPGRRWNDVDLGSFNGVFFVDGDVRIRGEVDGRLTIAASDDIEIWDDITYRGSEGN